MIVLACAILWPIGMTGQLPQLRGQGQQRLVAEGSDLQFHRGVGRQINRFIWNQNFAIEMSFNSSHGKHDTSFHPKSEQFKITQQLELFFLLVKQTNLRDSGADEGLGDAETDPGRGHIRAAHQAAVADA
jgi:hypothetical protein